MRTKVSYHPVWILPLYSDDKIYETMYLERENNKVLGLIGPIGKRSCLSTFMVHLDLVGMWVVLLWPPWLTHGPLSYLVLALLLCVYLCYDDSYLMGFIIRSLDHLLYGWTICCLWFYFIFGPLYVWFYVMTPLRPLVHYPKSFHFMILFL